MSSRASLDRGGSAKSTQEVATHHSDNCFVRFSTAVNNFLSAVFQRVGETCGKYPWVTILISILVSVTLGSSLFYRFKQESEADKLFVPQGTRSLTDKADVDAYWGQSSRFVSLVVATSPEDSFQNVVSKDILLATFDMLEEVQNFNATVDDTTTVTLEDICETIPTPFGDRCLVGSLFGAWLWQRDKLANDTDISKTLNDTFTEDELSKYIGGLEYSNGKPSNGKAIRITILLMNNATDSDPDDGKNELVDSAAEAWEAALVELTVEKGYDKIMVYPQTEWSFSEEIGGAILGDVMISSISYFIIIGYVVVVLQSTCDRVGSSTGLAFLGVVTIGLAILSAFGLSQYLNILYGNTHSILPFIILGLGADSVFIQTNSFRRADPTKPLHIRAGMGMAHAGVSITISSLTNVAAFAIGSLTVIPDLASFGKYASLSMFFLWVYSCTFFVACLVLNERRVQKGKLDCLCCFNDCREEGKQISTGEEYQPGRMSRWMKKYYAPLVANKVFQAFVILTTFGFAGYCGYRASLLTVESTGSNFLPTGSYLKTNFDIQAEYFGGQPTDVQVVIKDFKYDNKVELMGLGDKYRFSDYRTAPPYIDPSFQYFMEEFADLLNDPNQTDIVVDPAEVPLDAELGIKFPKDNELFIKYLKLYLNTTAGRLFEADVIFSDNGASVERARVRMQHLPIGSYVDGVFKEDASLVVKAMDKMYEISDAFTFTVYPYAMVYTSDWAAFAVIGDELFYNVLYCLIVVLVVVTILIGHPLTSFIVFLCVLLTTVMLLGMNSILGLAIDTVVTVLVVLSIGISVDYANHNAFAFMSATCTRKERIATVLEDTAVPVFHGAMSTFLAIMLQSLSKSYVFVVVFYEFTFAIVFSFWHGLVFLPVVLSLIGPKPYASAYKKNH